MQRIRIPILFLALIGMSSVARANDFLFSEAAFGVVSLALVGWLVLGGLLASAGTGLVYLGRGGFVVFLLCVGATVLIGHFEFGLMIWMIYVGLLTVRFALPRGAGLKARGLNLVFHGSFLLAVVIGGAVAKYLYWTKMGGYARWSAWMSEVFPPFLFAFGCIAAFVGLWFSLHSPASKRSKISLRSRSRGVEEMFSHAGENPAGRLEDRSVDRSRKEKSRVRK